jgi:hypothetical protein
MARRFAWRRVVTTAGLLSLTLAFLIPAPIAITAYVNYREYHPDPLPASDADQVAILQAVLALPRFHKAPVFVVPSRPPEGDGREAVPAESLPDAADDPGVPIVLSKEALAPCDTNSPDDEPESCAHFDELIGGPWSPTIPLKLRLELLGVVGHASSFRDIDSPGIQMATSAQIAAIPDPDGWSWYAGFYDRFPGTAGLLDATRAVLAHDGEHALIYVRRVTGLMDASGQLVYLVRREGEWQVETAVELWGA